MIMAFRVAGRNLLVAFMERHADSVGPLQSWLKEAQTADWASPADLKRRYPAASILADQRVVFNVKGNRYRLVVAVAYKARVIRIVWLGTHAEYDRQRF